MTDYPFSGDIINSTDAWDLMSRDLVDLRDKEIWIISAYLKLDAITNFGSRVHSSNNVRVLVRWQGVDLLGGSSDLEAYEYAVSRGWKFAARLDLHAKVYRIGDRSLYLGSANLTQSGFGLRGRGNAETMVSVGLTARSMVTLEALFLGQQIIDSELFALIKSWVDSAQVASQDAFQIEGYPLARVVGLGSSNLVKRSTELMVSDCFFSNPKEIISAAGKSFENLPVEVQHDLSLLGMGSPSIKRWTIDDISGLFQQSAMYRWLIYTLEEQPEKQLFFGETSACLHAALIDDPGPYRSEVKLILITLLDWIKYFTNCHISVDRPRHSERIFMKL
jgi:hypothetical protein